VAAIINKTGYIANLPARFHREKEKRPIIAKLRGKNLS